MSSFVHSRAERLRYASPVSVWRDATPAGSRWAPSRYALAGALIAALIVTGAALAVVGIGGKSGKRGHDGSGAVAAASGSGARQAGHSATTGSGKASGGALRNVAAERRDPEEANSHPAPPSLRHSSASSPAVAAKVVIAPGAASNSQVEEELEKVQDLERKATEVTSFKIVPGGDSIAGSGKIPIPTDVPAVVQRVIAGANAIADFPYVYGGGHASFVSNSYDCSGSVSYALAAGGLLTAPETSGQLESWGAAGPGKWITVYANAGHTYMYVNVGGAWMLYDTAGRSGVLTSRWQPSAVDNAGYVVRHWPGL
jgi:cell wall-associated NlpC family hydrolase